MDNNGGPGNYSDVDMDYTNSDDEAVVAQQYREAQWVCSGSNLATASSSDAAASTKPLRGAEGQRNSWDELTRLERSLSPS